MGNVDGEFARFYLAGFHSVTKSLKNQGPQKGLFYKTFLLHKSFFVKVLLTTKRYEELVLLTWIFGEPEMILLWHRCKDPFNKLDF